MTCDHQTPSDPNVDRELNQLANTFQELGQQLLEAAAIALVATSKLPSPIKEQIGGYIAALSGGFTVTHAPPGPVNVPVISSSSAKAWTEVSVGAGELAWGAGIVAGLAGAAILALPAAAPLLLGSGLN